GKGARRYRQADLLGPAVGDGRHPVYAQGRAAAVTPPASGIPAALPSIAGARPFFCLPRSVRFRPGGRHFRKRYLGWLARTRIGPSPTSASFEALQFFICNRGPRVMPTSRLLVALVGTILLCPAIAPAAES